MASTSLKPLFVATSLLIPFAASQARFPTMEPTVRPTLAPTTRQEGFVQATTLEVIILAAVIIGCPILILLWYRYQKNSTKKLIISRKRKDDDLMRGVMERKEIQMANRQKAITAMQQRQAQLSRPVSSSLAEGAPSREDDRATLLLHKSDAKPSSKGIAPPPPEEAPPKEAVDAANRRKDRQRAGTEIRSKNKSEPRAFRQQTVAATVRSGKDKKDNSKLKLKSKFQKIASLSDVQPMSAPVESALVLPDIEDEVEDAPPSMIPSSKTFDPQTGVPMDAEPTDELELSVSLKVDPEEDEQQERTNKKEKKKKKDVVLKRSQTTPLNKKTDGTFSSKGVPPPPAAEKDELLPAAKKDAASGLLSKSDGRASSKGVPPPPEAKKDASPPAAEKKDVALDLLSGDTEKKEPEKKKEKEKEKPKEEEEKKEPVAAAAKKEEQPKGNDVVLDMLTADEPKEEQQEKEPLKEKEKEPVQENVNDEAKEKQKEKEEEKGDQDKKPEESPAPPDLQTIFGRQVTKKDVGDESESEDSLMKRQADFLQNPDAAAAMADVQDAESQLVLNV